MKINSGCGENFYEIPDKLLREVDHIEYNPYHQNAIKYAQELLADESSLMKVDVENLLDNIRVHCYCNILLGNSYRRAGLHIVSDILNAVKLYDMRQISKHIH